MRQGFVLKPGEAGVFATADDRVEHNRVRNGKAEACLVLAPPITKGHLEEVLA
jgi:hypothetical protein